MKINWNYIRGFLLFGVLLFLFGFSNYRNLNQKVTSVKVQFEKGDNLFMSYEMVNKLLIQNAGTIKNKSKSLIDLNGLEKEVLAHPMVESATTYITVDGQFRISIKQRTPIGRVNTRTDSYYIDKQGEYMPLSENHSARVPIITGILESEDAEDLYELLSFIQRDEFLKKQIIGVHKSNEEEYNLMTRVGDHEINIGTIENLNTKFKNLKSFYSFAMEDGTIDKYKKLSLKYDNQVVGTKIK